MPTTTDRDFLEMAVAVRLLGQGGRLARPLGSDLTARLVEALGGGVREVRVDRLTEGTFYAVVSVDGLRGAIDVDARALLDELAAEASAEEPPGA